MTDVRMLHYVRRQYLYGDTVLRTHAALVDLFSVLTEKRSTRLFVQEHMASLAQ